MTNPLVVLVAAPECYCGTEHYLVTDGRRIATMSPVRVEREEHLLYLTCMQPVTADDDLCHEIHPDLDPVSLNDENAWWMVATPDQLALLEKGELL